MCLNCCDFYLQICEFFRLLINSPLLILNKTQIGERNQDWKNNGILRYSKKDIGNRGLVKVYLPLSILCTRYGTTPHKCRRQSSLLFHQICDRCNRQASQLHPEMAAGSAPVVPRQRHFPLVSSSSDYYCPWQWKLSPQARPSSPIFRSVPPQWANS